MMRSVVPALLLAATTVAAAAKEPPPRPAKPPEKVSELLVFGNDPCPKSSDPDEIVVCPRLPEGDRYRIPKRFRGKKLDGPESQSWAARAEQLDWITPEGRTNTCSTSGSAGQTGCYDKMMREWRAARRQIDADKADIP